MYNKGVMDPKPPAYEPRKKIENISPFSAYEENFLDAQLKDMEMDALNENDFLDKTINGKLITKEFIDECKADIVQKNNLYRHNDKVGELKDEIDDRTDRSPEHKKASRYLEALFYNKLGGKKGWIPNALVWKTGRTDDNNGIDFVIETEDREFSLATDVTFSHNKGLLRKLDKLKQNIKKGQIPKLTFYESASKEERPMPHIIIAVERDKVINALKLWADGQGDTLDEHPIKAKTMLEIEAQLEAFAMYAKALKKRDIAASYNDMLAQIQRLIVDHKDVIEKYQKRIDEDEAYKAIMNFCADLKQEAGQIAKE